MEYIYPAIFTKENEGYSIEFPDIENCFTSAPSIQEGIKMAQDVLCLVLYDYEEDSKPIPPASDIKELKISDESFSTLITCDTLEYRKFFDNKAVKKTLTIPSWMNKMAEKAGVNFSKVLQRGILTELGLDPELICVDPRVALKSRKGRMRV